MNIGYKRWEKNGTTWLYGSSPKHNMFVKTSRCSQLKVEDSHFFVYIHLNSMDALSFFLHFH